MSRKLNDFYDSFLEYTERTVESSHLYRKWVGLGIVSAALRRHCWLAWDSIQYPNQFILLVGPPAARKGTAMRKGTDILHNAGIPTLTGEITFPRLIKTLVAGEVVVEELAPYIDVVGPNRQSSLCVAPEEFTRFIGYEDQTFVVQLCSAYDGVPLEYFTEKHGDLRVPYPCFTLIGGTTPVSFRTALPPAIIGGGLSSRMVLVYADEAEKQIADPSMSDTELRLRLKLIEDLTHITEKLRGPFQWHPDALAAYKEFYLQQRANPPFLVTELEYYIARRQIHLIKMVMAFSVSRGDDLILTLADFNRAISLLHDTEKMMPRVYAGFGASEDNEVLQKVQRIVEKHGPIPHDYLWRLVLRDATYPQFERVVTALIRAKAIFVTRMTEKVGTESKIVAVYNAVTES